MGALLSQAVANQLRQYPGFQNPNPTPQNLLQQVLNPPGPSRPMWQAPLMENQRVLETSMDPTISAPQRAAANQALMQQAMQTALAFGGADITKEQKAAWEAENAAYRASRLSQLGNPARPEGYEPGTRVAMRPWGQRTGEPTSIYAPGKLKPPNQGDMAAGTGVIVTPGTPEAGEPAHRTMPEFATRVAKGMEPGPVRAGPLRGGVTPVGDQPPGPDYVAVRGDQSGHWFWRHRDSLEILPPLEKFKEGDAVEFRWSENEEPEFYGTVTKPPKGHAPSPGPDYVWVDVPRGLRPAKGYQGPKSYQGEAWGAWFNIKDLHRSKK